MSRTRSARRRSAAAGAPLDRAALAHGARDKLRTNLYRVRREGVAYSREEYEVGLHSIAVPLAWADSDEPVAGRLSLPSSRAGREATAALTEELRTTAAITGATA